MATVVEGRFQVHGANCVHCIATIERALRQLEGIIDVRVTLTEALVRYDADKLTLEQLQRAVRTVGFELVAP